MATEVSAEPPQNDQVDQSVLDRWFHIRERGSTVRTEVRDGATTFIVMYTFLKMASGKAGQVHWMMYLVSAAFALAAIHAVLEV